MNERTQKGKGKEKKTKTFYSSPYTLYIPCVAELGELSLSLFYSSEGSSILIDIFFFT